MANLSIVLSTRLLNVKIHDFYRTCIYILYIHIYMYDLQNCTHAAVKTCIKELFSWLGYISVSTLKDYSVK